MPLIELLPVGPDTAQWAVWGTVARIVVTDPAMLDDATAVVRDELDAVDAACSRFRPDSELTAACHAGGRPWRVPPPGRHRAADPQQPAHIRRGRRRAPGRALPGRRIPRSTVMNPTRLHIDWTACDGRGLCAELLPEVLAEDDWGYPVARDGSVEPAVPAALEPVARQAVGRCPALALRLVN